MKNRIFILLYESQLPPFPVLLVADSHTSQLKQFLGKNWSVLLLKIKNGFGSWYGKEKDAIELRELALKKINKCPSFIKRLQKIFIKKKALFLKFTNSFRDINFKEYDNQQVHGVFNKYCTEYIKICAFGELVPFAVEGILTENLKLQLKAEIKNSLPKKFNQIFTTLTTMPHLSFMMEEELNLLEIAIEPYNENLINDHMKKFLWVPFDYVGPAWGLDDLKKRLKKINKRYSKSFILQKIKKLKNQSTFIKRKQTILIKKYRLSAQVIKYAKLLQDCTLLFDMKKKMFSQSHYDLSFLLKEISSRYNINFELIYYLTAEEIKNILGNKIKLNNEVLLKRKKESYLISKNGFSRYLSKKESKRWLKLIEKEKISKYKNKIEGLPVSNGKVRGKVQVIFSLRNLNKMEPNKILVTKMTTIDFVPIMHMAKAIITDLGGITSHAAIVSRELRIPCIVGTKIATKILKSGDLIEVDAKEGIVKILKRK